MHGRRLCHIWVEEMLRTLFIYSTVCKTKPNINYLWMYKKGQILTVNYQIITERISTISITAFPYYGNLVDWEHLHVRDYFESRSSPFKPLQSAMIFFKNYCTFCGKFCLRNCGNYFISKSYFFSLRNIYINKYILVMVISVNLRRPPILHWPTTSHVSNVSRLQLSELNDQIQWTWIKWHKHEQIHPDTYTPSFTQPPFLYHISPSTPHPPFSPLDLSSIAWLSVPSWAIPQTHPTPPILPGIYSSEGVMDTQ